MKYHNLMKKITSKSIEAEEYIKHFARLHGCISGICNAAPLEEERARLAVATPFVSRDIDKRTNPGLSLPGAKSVIVLGKGYNPSPYSNLSSLGWGMDYHTTLTTILEELAKILNTKIFNTEIPDTEIINKGNTRPNPALPISCISMVDNGPLAERAFAVKAGLGSWGRNTCVISPEFGSFFNIGLLVVDIDLPSGNVASYNSIPGKGSHNLAINSTCPTDCRRCIDACPTGALKPYSLNPAICISYITQKKGHLEDSQISAISTSGQLYGCDLCQIVCPKNKVHSPKLRKDPKRILSMNSAAFKEEFGHTAMAWRGLEHLQRNAKYLK